MQDSAAQGRKPEQSITGGYQVGYFAFRHGLTEQQALELVHRIGHDRRLLDAAALKLKKKMLIGNCE
jgi:hypothetical protein